MQRIAREDRARTGRRGGIAATLILHAAILGLLSRMSSPPTMPVEPDALVTFDVPPPPAPPVPQSDPAPARAPEPEGAAAPEGRRATPSPIVVAPPIIPIALPPPVIAAPIAGAGAAPDAGAADRGTGTGAGGAGAGLGSGRGGEGTGGGGGGTRARLVRGAIVDRDYPAAARRAGAMGSATVSFTVGTDGRARDCSVVRSAGHAALDTATCRLIEARFHYRPALGDDGRPVAETRGWRQRWWFAADD